MNLFGMLRCGVTHALLVAEKKHRIMALASHVRAADAASFSGVPSVTESPIHYNLEVTRSLTLRSAALLNKCSFKERKSLAQRRAEFYYIKQKFSAKVPIIVERFDKEKQLPTLDKSKFLVPGEMGIFQLMDVIRTRMKLNPKVAFYLLVNNKSLACLTLTVADVYRDEHDEDGFLYVTYASQEMFGWARCQPHALS